MRTRLIFVRHAEATGNVERLFHGWTDSNITEKGHEQAKFAAQRLKNVPIDVIYSSSLTRTMQTAQYIADIKNLEIIPTDNLKEINGGDWENVAFEELPKKWPREYQHWEEQPHLLTMPNGESMEQFQKRLIDEVMYIISRNEGKNVCIVTHGTAIKAMLCCFKKCSLEAMKKNEWHENTSITIIDYENDTFKIILEGDSSHLGTELKTMENQEWWLKYKERLQMKGEADDK